MYMYQYWQWCKSFFEEYRFHYTFISKLDPVVLILYCTGCKHICYMYSLTFSLVQGLERHVDYGNAYGANNVSNNKHNEKENAVEKFHLIQFLTMLFNFGECAHAAAHKNAIVSFWFYCVNNNRSDWVTDLHICMEAWLHKVLILLESSLGWPVKSIENRQFLSSNELLKTEWA